MAKSKGRAFLLQISDGALGFQGFAGLTGKSLKINNERIDVTTPDATTPQGEHWRETLDGVKSVSLSGDGRTVGEAAELRLISIAMGEAATDTFRVIHPTLGTFEGEFSLEVELGDDGGTTFAATMESTGPITYTAP